jgi:hypothetical protein
LSFNTTGCPADFPLMMFAANPSQLQECRPTTQQCVAPYDILLTAANTSIVLGCTQSSATACPLGAVAYLEYNSATPWALQQCRVNGTCNTFTTMADSRFAVPALSATNTLVGCLTLDPTPNAPTQQACPAVPGVNFPVEVTDALFPGCGSIVSPPGLQCAYAATKMCLAPDASCPQAFPFQLVGYNTADTPGALAGCRSARPFCDLSMQNMRPPPGNGADPNAPDNGNYTIRLVSSGNLMGCIQGGAAACPASFPFPTRNPATNALLECNTNGTNITSCPVPGGDPQLTVEAEDQDGVVVECLSPFQPCPPPYSVAARVLAGTPPALYTERCIARSVTGACPGSFPFPFFAPVPDAAAGGANVTSLTNCWQANAVAACNIQVTCTCSALRVGVLRMSSACVPAYCNTSWQR